MWLQVIIVIEYGYKFSFRFFRKMIRISRYSLVLNQIKNSDARILICHLLQFEFDTGTHFAKTNAEFPVFERLATHGIHRLKQPRRTGTISRKNDGEQRF